MSCLPCSGTQRHCKIHIRRALVTCRFVVDSNADAQQPLVCAASPCVSPGAVSWPSKGALTDTPICCCCFRICCRPNFACCSRQLANVHREARSLPAHKMLQAISKVLDLSQRFPEIDLVPLIKPVIEAAKVHYSLDALMPKVKSMKRLLPDTALRDALMREGERHTHRGWLCVCVCVNWGALQGTRSLLTLPLLLVPTAEKVDVLLQSTKSVRWDRS